MVNTPDTHPRHHGHPTAAAEPVVPGIRRSPPPEISPPSRNTTLFPHTFRPRLVSKNKAVILLYFVFPDNMVWASPRSSPHRASMSAPNTLTGSTFVMFPTQTSASPARGLVHLLLRSEPMSTRCSCARFRLHATPRKPLPFPVISVRPGRSNCHCDCSTRQLRNVLPLRRLFTLESIKF